MTGQPNAQRRDVISQRSAALEDLLVEEGLTARVRAEIQDLLEAAAESGRVTPSQPDREALRRIVVFWAATLRIRTDELVLPPSIAPPAQREAAELREISLDQLIARLQRGELVTGVVVRECDLTRMPGVDGRRGRKSIGKVRIVDSVLENCKLANLELARESEFIHVNMTGADMRGIVAPSIRANSAILRNAKLQGSYLRGGDFAGADLSDTELDHLANLTRCTFSNASVAGMHGAGAQFSHAVFTSASMEGAELPGAVCTEVYFIRAEAQNADFTSTVLDRANFSEADVFGADFIGAELTDTDFERAKNVLSATFDTTNWERARFDPAVTSGLRARAEQGEPNDSPAIVRFRSPRS